MRKPQTRLDDLAEKATEGRLTDRERAEYAAYVSAIDFISILQAKSRTILSSASLSNFKRDTSGFLERLKESGEPVVLTINGKAEIVVQDAGSYQRLLEASEQIKSLEFLRESLEEVDSGRTQPMRKAVASLGKQKRR